MYSRWNGVYSSNLAESDFYETPRGILPNLYIREVNQSSIGDVGNPYWSEVVVYHDLAALSKLDNMKDSLPSEAPCSLPALIWRMSLGLEA